MEDGSSAAAAVLPAAVVDAAERMGRIRVQA